MSADIAVGGTTRASLDRRGIAAIGLAGVLITAGGLVAAVNSAAPFDHGSWLAAYLVLVGGVAQVLLLLAPVVVAEDATGTSAAPVWFWSAGSVAVPAGVLAGSVAAVGVGSAPLVAALVLLARDARHARWAGRGWAWAYAALLVMLGTSIVVGVALAGAS